MNKLADIIFDLQGRGVGASDIKRMINAMLPQGAAALVAKHNQATPNSPWNLLKKDPNGQEEIDNMVDKNLINHYKNN